MVEKIRPDAIVVWGMWNLPRSMLGMLEQRQKPRLVFYLADYWPELPDAYTLYWREPSRNTWMKLPKTILGKYALWRLSTEPKQHKSQLENAVCVSGAVRQKLMTEGYISARACVIHNGIDLAKYQHNYQDQKQQRDANVLKLVYCGRVTPEKGVMTIVQALSHLPSHNPKVTLTIIGDGPADYVAKLVEFCRRENTYERVNYYGKVSREKIPDLLPQFDILVVPSIWPDPLPRNIQEGMAMGLVVVGSNVGGIPEILSDGVNGLCFRPGDAINLAQCIEKLINQPELIEKYSKAGQQTVRERFDIRRTVLDVEVYIQQVINETTEPTTSGYPA
jgi:glycosyltransferase involved in cell wall biosynthesis